MSNANNEYHKKSISVLEKLGQRITTIKEDIADNIERRKHSLSIGNTNQIRLATRTTVTDEVFINEKKSPISFESQLVRKFGDENSNTESMNSISRLAMNFSKETTDNTLFAATPSMVHSDLVRSFQDIFSTASAEQAKDLIMNTVRHGLYRNQSRAPIETSQDDYTVHRIDMSDLSNKSSAAHINTTVQNPTRLLVGPKFRCHTVEPEMQTVRDIIYPISSAVGFVTLMIGLWKPISSFFSGLLVGFIIMIAIAYTLTRIYTNAKVDESVIHEWINFPEIEHVHQEKTSKEDKHTMLHTCGEIVFGRYDIDRDDAYIRYPVVVGLKNYHLKIQLPTKAREEENKDKEIRFVGHRKYYLKEANLTLVPEATMTRMKYWMNEYPIVIQDLKIFNKQIYSQEYLEKSKFDTDHFFNNSQTAIALFLETGPEKENWFNKLSLVIRKNKDEIERANYSSIGIPSVSLTTTSSTLNTITQNIPDTQIPLLNTRVLEMQANAVNFDEHVRMKLAESIAATNSDTTSTEKSDTEVTRSQINGTDILSDMPPVRHVAQEFRNEIMEKEKKGNEKDSEKDSTGSSRVAAVKKKFRKQEENLERLLVSSDCLDDAALTLNFLTRRLFYDISEETLFKNLMKEKIELKLKEIAVSVLEDLHVESIDLGKTFPVILKVEPMQWNAKGIWFNLFFFYRGSFKITIKSRLVLLPLLNYNPNYNQPMYAQHHSAQTIHKEDRKLDNDDLIQRQKLLAKEPEIPENAASRKLGTLLTKVASNKHFQRFTALKPVVGVIEKLSNAEVGANIELSNFSGIMTINIPPPPSDRVWIGFPEMPDLSLKVTPVFGENKYSYSLIHDFLESRMRDELKRMAVLPCMDDQLLPFFRDWVIDVIGEIASKSVNPLNCYL